jgi:hypothetical protein
VVTFKNFSIVLKKRADMLKKTWEVEKEAKSAKTVKNVGVRKICSKNMFYSIFFILLIYRRLGKNRQKSRKKL